MEPAAPLAYAVERIGDRWTILIVDALMSGPRKFGELEADVTGIAPTVLTKRLRQLDTDGIVVGRPYSERPLRFSYELTGRQRLRHLGRRWLDHRVRLEPALTIVEVA